MKTYDQLSRLGKLYSIIGSSFSKRSEFKIVDTNPIRKKNKFCKQIDLVGLGLKIPLILVSDRSSFSLNQFERFINYYNYRGAPKIFPLCFFAKTRFFEKSGAYNFLEKHNDNLLYRYVVDNDFVDRINFIDLKERSIVVRKVGRYENGFEIKNRFSIDGPRELGYKGSMYSIKLEEYEGLIVPKLVLFDDVTMRDNVHLLKFRNKQSLNQLEFFLE